MNGLKKTVKTENIKTEEKRKTEENGQENRSRIVKRKQNTVVNRRKQLEKHRRKQIKKKITEENS